MSNLYLFAISFLLEAFVLLGFNFIIFLKNYLKTNHFSNLLMSLGNAFVLFSYLISFFSSFLDENDIERAKMILSITNMFITIGLFFIALSLFYVRTKYFNLSTIVGSFLIGVSFITVSNTDNLLIYYNEKIDFWVNDYSKYTNILLSSIFAIIFILIAFYVVEKIRFLFKKRKYFSFTILGIVLSFIWLGIISIPGVYIYRIFLLPLALFFMGIDNLMNPLCLIVSRNKPEELFLLSKSNVPLIGYNYIKRERIEDLSNIRILRVSQLLIGEKVGETEDSYFSAKEGELLSIGYGHFILTAIGKKIDPHLKSVLYLTLRDFSEIVNIPQFLSSELLKKEEEKCFLDLLNAYLDGILF